MEEKLINDLAKGDQDAFKDLIENFQDKVFNTCYGFVHNSDDADDLAQEVFIEVFRSINKFKHDSSLSTWLYRISVNKSLDYIRKQNRTKRWGGILRFSTDNDDIKENWIANNETPEISMEQNERIAVLNSAIAKLPDNQKTAFTLSKYEELSYKEIAEVMQTSVSSVESLLHRAKKNLKSLLEKYYKENFK